MARFKGQLYYWLNNRLYKLKIIIKLYAQMDKSPKKTEKEIIFLTGHDQVALFQIGNLFVPMVHNPSTNLAMGLFLKRKVDEHGFNLLYRFDVGKVMALHQLVDQA
jgi:hypothetical protein